MIFSGLPVALCAKNKSKQTNKKTRFANFSIETSNGVAALPS